MSLSFSILLTALLLSAALFPGAQTYLPNERKPAQRTLLTIKNKLPDNTLIVSSEQPTSPGIVAHFKTARGTVVVQLFQKLSASDFLGRVYSSQNNAGIHDLMPGETAETDAQVGYDPADFWTSLKNLYLNDSGNWLSHVIVNNQSSCKVKISEPVFINLNKPPVSGYICVLAIAEDRSVNVIYPNNELNGSNVKIVANTPCYHLNYSVKSAEPALINIGFAFETKGKHSIFVIISKYPRPLADFIPKESAAYHYSDLSDLLHLSPTDFGPGYWNIKSDLLKEQTEKSVDYIPGDEWAVSRIEIQAD